MTTPESKGPAVIDATTLAERLGRHEPVTVLDVRRPERWSEDRDCIPGAAWVPHEGAAGAGRTALGARLLGRAGLIRKFDQVHGAILERLERVRPGDWALAMHYPTRWDPRFKTPMHMEDLFRYPIDHLRHHRHQLRAAQ